MKKCISLLLSLLKVLSLSACGNVDGSQGTYKDQWGISEISFFGTKVEFMMETYNKIVSEADYLIPPVTTESKFLAWTDKMPQDKSVLVKDYYKKYDINRLSKRENKEELLERYSAIETEIIYILREATKDNVKKKLEELFKEAGYTAKDYIEDYFMDKSNK